MNKLFQHFDPANVLDQMAEWIRNPDIGRNFDARVMTITMWMEPRNPAARDYSPWYKAYVYYEKTRK